MSTPPTPSTDQVRADFDRLATLEGPGPDHNAVYHRFLLDHVPPRAGEALEVGCGRGEFARALARRAARVTASDLSPEMIRIARERSVGLANLEIVEADILSFPLEESRYDYIASIAMLHHVEAGAVLVKLARALRPGGRLAILDVRSARGPLEHILALSAGGWMRLLSGRLRPDPAVHAAWAEHGRRERYLTYAEALSLGRAYLPRCTVRRHVLWRYSIVWAKPGGAA